MRQFLSVLVLLCLLPWQSNVSAQEVRYEIRFPDLPGYTTLKCDFHIHTVFSDGEVWPTVRVREAWREGLDCIALTDHIEHHRHAADVSEDMNRVRERAADLARQLNILLIRGGEMTKETPPGHFNAIFVKDLGPLNDPDLLKQARLATEQGGFVFWNHPWGKWTDTHETLHRNGWLRGIEVCNGPEEPRLANNFRIGLEKNLTLLGNSDIHPPETRTRSTADDHRTMTLVFARQRSIKAVKEALGERRTAVWFHGQVIGRQEWLAPLFERSISDLRPTRREGDRLWLTAENLTSTDIQLERTGRVGPPTLTLPAQATTSFWIAVEPGRPAPSELPYVATNFFIGPDKPLPVKLKIAGSQPE
jgi:3',5'-nucleoside bisphosphate phosphatase